MGIHFGPHSIPRLPDAEFIGPLQPLGASNHSSHVVHSGFPEHEGMPAPKPHPASNIWNAGFEIMRFVAPALPQFLRRPIGAVDALLTI